MFFIEIGKNLLAAIRDKPIAPKERFHFVNANRMSTVNTNMSNYNTATRVIHVAEDMATDYIMGTGTIADYKLALNVLEVAAGKSRSATISQGAVDAFAHIVQLQKIIAKPEPTLAFYEKKFDITPT